MNIALIEDNVVTCDTLKLLLAAETAFNSVTSYNSAEDFLEKAADTANDILLVDLDLPGMHGTELIRIARQRFPASDCMVYTVYEDRENVFAALKAGATGYVLKGSSSRELIDALICLYEGGAPMTPRIARKVLQEFQQAPSPENPLSVKESIIVRCIEEGLTYKEIADRQSISHHTVHTHIKNIYEKLQANGRREALKRARVIGII